MLSMCTLAVVLLLVLPAVSPSVSQSSETRLDNVLIDPFPVEGRFQFSTCPTWLQDYVQFHLLTRGKPEARYLLAQEIPTGLGDALRGLKYALKLAMATQRVLLIHDKKTSGKVTGHLLVPNLIDWTFTPTDLGLEEDVGHTAPRMVFARLNDTRYPAWLTLAAGEEKVVRIHSVMTEVDMNTLPLPTPSFLNISSSKGESVACSNCPYRLEDMIGSSCALRALFKASVDLQNDYSSTMQAIFNRTAASYIAIHLRLGGLHGGKENDLGKQRVAKDDSLRDNLVLLVLRTLVCAQQAARDQNITGPVLLLTDNDKLRQLVQQNKFGRDVVSTPFEAVHLQYAQGSDDSITRSIYVDMMLMAGAKCLLAPMRSGFNHQARLWGGIECFNPNDGCKELDGTQVMKRFYSFRRATRR